MEENGGEGAVYFSDRRRMEAQVIHIDGGEWRRSRSVFLRSKVQQRWRRMEAHISLGFCLMVQQCNRRFLKLEGIRGDVEHEPKKLRLLVMRPGIAAHWRKPSCGEIRVSKGAGSGLRIVSSCS
ncbi:hypothetical protein ACLB2K_066733 [Fragaria x ananassa]